MTGKESLLIFGGKSFKVFTLHLRIEHYIKLSVLLLDESKSCAGAYLVTFLVNDGDRKDG